MITIVSNRHQILYSDLITHLKRCSHPSINRIILREKDLSQEAIIKKIRMIKSTPKLKKIPLFLNGPYELSETFGADGRHYTMAQFESLKTMPEFPVGVSVHSLEEIEGLNQSPIAYALYGHVFSTACKAGLSARGVDNLEVLLERSKAPLVVLGGIDQKNYKCLYQKGCQEIALMSSAMKTSDPKAYLSSFEAPNRPNI